MFRVAPRWFSTTDATARISTSRDCPPSVRLLPDHPGVMNSPTSARGAAPFGRTAASRVTRAALAVTLTMTAAVLLSLATMLSAEPAGASSRWTAPVQPVTIVSAFDPPAQRWRAGHRGVDLAGTGTVHAAGSGTVTFAGQLAGRGVVSVSHGRLRTTYEPVDATVAVGQSVAAGQPIGIIGAGGHCSRRCLHWGLLAGERYLDPMLLLRMGPPVLKSLTGRSATSRSIGISRPRADSGIAARTQDGSSRGTHRPVEDVAPSQSSSNGTVGAALGGGLIVSGSIVAVAMRRKRRRQAPRSVHG